MEKLASMIVGHYAEGVPAVRDLLTAKRSKQEPDAFRVVKALIYYELVYLDIY